VPSGDQRDEFGEQQFAGGTTERAARSAAARSGPHSAVVMRRHGATVVGAGVRASWCTLVRMARTPNTRCDALALGARPVDVRRPRPPACIICSPVAVARLGTIGPPRAEESRAI